MSDERRFTIEDFIGTRRLGDVVASPDGRWAVFTVAELNAKGDAFDTNIWRLDLTDAGAEPVALTNDTRKKGNLRFRPDGLLGFVCEPASDERGKTEAKDEKDEPKGQLHLLDPTGGAPRRITDLPGGVVDFRWSPDGSRLALLAKVLPDARDLDHERELRERRKKELGSGTVHDAWPIRYWDHFVGPDFPHLLVAGPNGESPRDLMTGERHRMNESSLSLSPDASFIALDWLEVDDDRRIWSRACVIDAETGERRLLTEGNENSWCGRFSPDGRRLVTIVQTRQPGATGKHDLVLFDLDSAERRTLTSGFDGWPGDPRWLDDVRLLWSADQDGRHRLFLQSIDGGEPRALTTEGCVAAWCAVPGRSELLVSLNRFDRPSDLHALSLEGGEPRRLTTLNPVLTEERELPPGRSITYEGADGRSIQAWELLPPGFDDTRRYPFLLWIHGGPLGSYRDEYHARWNAALYAAAGYVVVLVNPAGSTGFGQDIVESNYSNWGDVCFRDLMAAADHWCAKPWVDETRTAALGASFGGYMVNWIHGQTDRFRALVCHAGLYDMPAFHGTTDAGPNWEIEFGDAPGREGSRWERHSPSDHVEAWSTPTLVIHGELDYRVPIGEGLAAFQALQRRGVRSRLLYFPDENHWILKPANLLQWNREVLGWLDEHVGPPE